MPPIGTPREGRFAFVISNEERDMLNELATAEHRTAGDWIRVQIHAAYAQHSKKAKKKPAKK